MPAKAQARLVISGRVQGVFFRYAMAREAERLQVNGWVRNCRDGTVEAALEGERKAVENLISWCHQGPPGAIVRKVDIEWPEEQGGFDSFSIKGWG